jgi:hypothetical protein
MQPKRMPLKISHKLELLNRQRARLVECFHYNFQLVSRPLAIILGSQFLFRKLDHT